ncbi:MAG: zinc ABC transporter substrate-binding protein [Gemmatimonadetes bacterium]|nr:zinc ABC transporter substrate-binding protein [Gemmatimonadota bacterium]
MRRQPGARLSVSELAAAALASAVFLAGASPAFALRVVAATNDLGALARAVGGPEIELDVVARADRDPHALEVRPSTLRKTAKADMYLEVGFDLDAWSAHIVRGSRNRDLIVVPCSEVIEPAEVPTGPVDASQGDVHPQGNPHYWLDPQNAVRVAEHLAAVFADADPDHAADYLRRAAEFAASVEERLPAWRAALEGRRFVEYHRTWVYFAERFGMTIAGEVEPFPGIPPGARHLALLAETIRRDSVPVVVRQVYHPDSPLDFLHRETGVRVEVLPASCAEPTPAAYLELIEHAVRILGGHGPPGEDGP